MTIYATAQEIVTSAAQELGLGTINLANTSGDENGYQIFGMLNALGEEILRVNDWQNLQNTLTFTGDGVTGTFPLPSDFGRQVNQTQWSVSDRRPLVGPVSPQVWGWCQYGLVSVGIWYAYRILQNEYNVFPIPGNGVEFALYYISKNWVLATPANPGDPPVYIDKLIAPTDTPLFDRRLLIAGLKARFWAQKGFDSTALQAEFDYMLANEIAQNEGARVINLSGSPDRFLIGWGNVPETGVGI